MFINCKHCGTLVATDPVSDQPPERCPRCRGALRAPTAPTPSVATLLRQAPPAPAPTSERDTPAAPTGPGVASPAPAVPPTTPATPSPAAATRARPEAPAVAPDAAPAVATAPAAGGTPPADPAPPAAPAPQSTPAPTPEAAATPAVAGPPASPATPDAAAESPSPVATPIPDRRSAGRLPGPGIARTSPSFARRVRAAGATDSLRQRRLLLGGVVALSLLLVLQVLLADRARLARDPGWRPLLTTVCAVLRCSLPPWREPAALTLLARDVRPDPDTPAHLLVHATFRNDARWAQGWPHLRLTLSDVDGRAVGTRTFAPDDYLSDTGRAETLDAGQSADVRLVLREPDGRAVSFAFDFI